MSMSNKNISVFESYLKYMLGEIIQETLLNQGSDYDKMKKEHGHYFSDVFADRIVQHYLNHNSWYSEVLSFINNNPNTSFKSISKIAMLNWNDFLKRVYFNKVGMDYLKDSRHVVDWKKLKDEIQNNITKANLQKNYLKEHQLLKERWRISKRTGRFLFRQFDYITELHFSDRFRTRKTFHAADTVMRGVRKDFKDTYKLNFIKQVRFTTSEKTKDVLDYVKSWDKHIINKRPDKLTDFEIYSICFNKFKSVVVELYKHRRNLTIEKEIKRKKPLKEVQIKELDKEILRQLDRIDNLVVSKNIKNFKDEIFVLTSKHSANFKKREIGI